MPESVAQRSKALKDNAEQREVYALLLSIQQDLAALRQTLNTHVHTANNTVLTTPAAALNTTI